MTYSGGLDLFCMIAQGDYQFWLLRENQWKGPQGPKDDSWCGDHFSEILCRTLKVCQSWKMPSSNHFSSFLGSSESSKKGHRKVGPLRIPLGVCVWVGSTRVGRAQVLLCPFWKPHGEKNCKAPYQCLNCCSLALSMTMIPESVGKSMQNHRPFGKQKSPPELVFLFKFEGSLGPNLSC